MAESLLVLSKLFEALSKNEPEDIETIRQETSVRVKRREFDKELLSKDQFATDNLIDEDTRLALQLQVQCITRINDNMNQDNGNANGKMLDQVPSIFAARRSGRRNAKKIHLKHINTVKIASLERKSYDFFGINCIQNKKTDKLDHETFDSVERSGKIKDYNSEQGMNDHDDIHFFGIKCIQQSEEIETDREFTKNMKTNDSHKKHDSIERIVKRKDCHSEQEMNGCDDTHFFGIKCIQQSEERKTDSDFYNNTDSRYKNHSIVRSIKQKNCHSEQEMEGCDDIHFFGIKCTQQLYPTKNKKTDDSHYKKHDSIGRGGKRKDCHSEQQRKYFDDRLQGHNRQNGEKAIDMGYSWKREDFVEPCSKKMDDFFRIKSIQRSDEKETDNLHSDKKGKVKRNAMKIVKKNVKENVEKRVKIKEKKKVKKKEHEMEDNVTGHRKRKHSSSENKRNNYFGTKCIQQSEEKEIDREEYSKKRKIDNEREYKLHYEKPDSMERSGKIKDSHSRQEKNDCNDLQHELSHRNGEKHVADFFDLGIECIQQNKGKETNSLHLHKKGKKKKKRHGKEANVKEHRKRKHNHYGEKGADFFDFTETHSKIKDSQSGEIVDDFLGMECILESKEKETDSLYLHKKEKRKKKKKHVKEANGKEHRKRKHSHSSEANSKKEDSQSGEIVADFLGMECIQEGKEKETGSLHLHKKEKKKKTKKHVKEANGKEHRKRKHSHSGEKQADFFDSPEANSKNEDSQSGDIVAEKTKKHKKAAGVKEYKKRRYSHSSNKWADFFDSPSHSGEKMDYFFGMECIQQSEEKGTDSLHLPGKGKEKKKTHETEVSVKEYRKVHSKIKDSLSGEKRADFFGMECIEQNKEKETETCSLHLHKKGKGKTKKHEKKASVKKCRKRKHSHPEDKKADFFDIQQGVEKDIVREFSKNKKLNESHHEKYDSIQRISEREDINFEHERNYCDDLRQEHNRQWGERDIGRGNSKDYLEQHPEEHNKRNDGQYVETRDDTFGIRWIQQNEETEHNREYFKNNKTDDSHHEKNYSIERSSEAAGNDSEPENYDFGDLQQEHHHQMEEYKKFERSSEGEVSDSDQESDDFADLEQKHNRRHLWKKSKEHELCREKENFPEVHSKTIDGHFLETSNDSFGIRYIQQNKGKETDREYSKNMRTDESHHENYDTIRRSSEGKDSYFKQERDHFDDLQEEHSCQMEEKEKENKKYKAVCKKEDPADVSEQERHSRRKMDKQDELEYNICKVKKEEEDDRKEQYH